MQGAGTTPDYTVTKELLPLHNQQSVAAKVSQTL
jgi:hypothetical protein